MTASKDRVVFHPCRLSVAPKRALNRLQSRGWCRGREFGAAAAPTAPIDSGTPSRPTLPHGVLVSISTKIYATTRVNCRSVGFHAVGILALLGLTPTVGLSQEVLRESPAGLRDVAGSQRIVLGDRDGPGYVGPNFSVAEIPEGGFLVSVFERAGELLAFGADGQLQGVIGRVGEGPGEFHNLGQVRVDDHYAYLIDQRQRRVTVLELDDLSFDRTFRLPAVPGDLAVLSTGRLVLAMDVATPEHAGHPYHLIDRDGSFLRSFGGAGGVYRSDRSHLLQRVVAPDRRPGLFWGATVHRYQLTLMDESGAVRRSLERREPWFEPHERGVIADPSDPPRPRLHHIRMDSAGRLWVLIQIPAERWREGLVERTTPRGQTYWTIGDESRFLDTVVEVIDPAAGEVIARGRFDPLFRHFASDGTAVSYGEDAGGVPFIRVWDLVIR